MTKTVFFAAALPLMLNLAVAHAQERHASALPTFAALSGVSHAAPALAVADRQPERRLTWTEMTTGTSPIDAVLPNGLRENGYN